jgi:2Fe-2S ferredoxin
LQADGTRKTYDAAEGLSVMQVAVANGVPGIVAECGGSTACATCKVELDPEWLSRVPPPDESEASLLDGEPPTVRLSCQLKLGQGTDGIQVTVPKSQYR